ncbi:MAG: hypothetical protein H6861_07030 [Rhodospirillales bacterium]|nr:hypothetical protein [Rhodospirillales bacterium]
MGEFEALTRKFYEIEAYYQGQNESFALEMHGNCQWLFPKKLEEAVSRAQELFSLLENAMREDGLTLEEMRQMDDVLFVAQSLADNAGQSLSAVVGTARYDACVEELIRCFPEIEDCQDTPSIFSL